MVMRYHCPLTFFATQAESFDTAGVTDVAEDGFDDTEAVAVDMATQGRVNFLFHPLKGGRSWPCRSGRF